MYFFSTFLYRYLQGRFFSLLPTPFYMCNRLVHQVILSCLLLIGTVQFAFGQRWAVDDTYYLYENAPIQLHVLSNDEGEELSILEVEIADYPLRGTVVKNFACNCLLYTPFFNFGVTVFEDSFTYLLNEEIDASANGGIEITSLSTNVATVFLFFMEDECEECVWPGDVNADGICNAWDLLPIGLRFIHILGYYSKAIDFTSMMVLNFSKPLDIVEGPGGR